MENNVINTLKDYSSGNITLRFPALPGMNEAALIFSYDGWSTMEEANMTRDADNEFFCTRLELKDDISYRYSYTRKDEPGILHYEDNNQKNFYIPKKKIAFQKLHDLRENLGKVIKEGKNILISDRSDLSARVAFRFDNIFYFRSVLDNFREFFIYSPFTRSHITKKMDRHITWFSDLKHLRLNRSINQTAEDLIRDKVQICLTTPLKGTYTHLCTLSEFLNLNLDYMISDNYIIWQIGAHNEI